MMEITIPTFDWKQIGGDVDPGAHGGTIAHGDGQTIELIKIQPVREYVGDKEAKEVGFPFWTRVASFDATDLDPKNEDVRKALESVDLVDLTKCPPETRAIWIAEAIFDYGRGDEGPSGWSDDIGIPDKVKWWSSARSGAEYLADEDQTFRDDVLGYAEIKTKIEEAVEAMADQSAAEAWSTTGDQLTSDIEEAGFDPKSIVIEGQFGDGVAVNGDPLVGGWAVALHEQGYTDVKSNDLWSEVGVVSLDGWLESHGYEYLPKFGGRMPEQEDYAYSDHVIDHVADEMDLDREVVEAAAKELDWWQEEIPWGTSGHTSVWAKRKAGAEERRTMGLEMTRRTSGELTPNEMAVLRAIADSEYQRGRTTALLTNNRIWSFSIADNLPKESPLSGRQISGVVSSLAKKGYVRSYKYDKDDTVALTAAGVRALGIQ